MRKGTTNPHTSSVSTDTVASPANPTHGPGVGGVGTGMDINLNKRKQKKERSCLARLDRGTAGSTNKATGKLS